MTRRGEDGGGGGYVLLLSVLTWACCVHGGHGFFFTVQETKTARHPVNAECVQKAQTPSCDFFYCFHQRFPCAHNDFALSAYRSCFSMADKMHLLNDQAKHFARETGKCYTKFILDNLYRNETLNCVQAEKMSREKYAECFAQHGGCDAAMWISNKRVLPQFISFRRHSMMRLFYKFKKCGTRAAMRLISWIRRNVQPIIP